MRTDVHKLFPINPNVVILYMLPVWVIAFEIFIVIMFGAFFRLDTSTLTNASSFTSNLVFLFGILPRL